MFRFLDPIFPVASALLPSSPIDQMKLRAEHLIKEDFYNDNYILQDDKDELVIDNVNKPVDFVLENEEAIRKMFKFRPE